MELYCGPGNENTCSYTPLLVPAMPALAGSTWSALAGSLYLAWSPTGSMFAGTANDGARRGIAVIGLRGNGFRIIVRCRESNCGDEGIAWSPTGTRLAYVTPLPGSTAIDVVDLRGRRSQRLRINAFAVDGLDWQARARP
jgi:Tol biopolymer transport system component